MVCSRRQFLETSLQMAPAVPLGLWALSGGGCSPAGTDDPGIIGHQPSGRAPLSTQWLGGIQVGVEELQQMREPPFPIIDGALFVAYYVTAELSCFAALGWRFPKHILDLCIEFRCIANGYRKPKSYRLIDALPYYGLPALDACEKKEMQDLAIRGAPFSPTERDGLLDYCESDVVSLIRLLSR